MYFHADEIMDVQDYLNGNPHQCSCLVNPRDGGAWWAAVYGVAQSRTRLKRLSNSSSKIIYHNNICNRKLETNQMFINRKLNEWWHIHTEEYHVEI